MKNAAAILSVGFALAGCATTAGTLSSGHTLDASGESVVIGRVEMVRDGKPVTPAPDLLVGRMSLAAEHDTSGKTYVIECDTRGFLSDFYVSLPPGRYRITGWKSANLGMKLQASFDVAPRQVVYVGTLRYTPTAIHPLLCQAAGVWTVVDGSADTLRSFRERFPQLQQPAAKSLMSVTY
jgi:hypothetical protein